MGRALVLNASETPLAVVAARRAVVMVLKEKADHVIPRSKGGLHEGENVVASCRRCNARKEDRTPQEAGFRLLRQPYAPRDGFHLTLGRIEPGWELYLAS